MKRHTQLVFLAAVTVLMAIVPMAWLLSAPQASTLTGRAIVLLVSVVCALRYIRRFPSASPAVLCATVIGGVLLVAKPGGPLFVIAVPVFAAFLWAVIAIARSEIMRAWTRPFATGWRRSVNTRPSEASR
jgi:hypothetical protein